MASNVTKASSTASSESEFESDIVSKPKNLLFVILYIIWFPFKIILYPFFYVLRQFKNLVNFLTNRSNAPLNFEEIALVESVPVFFTLASLELAILLGAIASIGFSEKVKNFLSSLTKGLGGLTDIVTVIIDLFTAIIGGLYNLVVNIILGGTWSFITSIHLDPVLLLFIAIILIVLLIVVIMVVTELDIISRIMRKLGYFGLGIAELPYALYESLDHWWMRFLKSFGRFITSNMVTTQQRTFYRRIITFVSLYAIWTFAWGVLILTSQVLDTNYFTELKNNDFLYKQIYYFVLVILLSGFLAGTILMFVLSRVLKIVTKNRYTAEQKQIDFIRHESLLNFMRPKSHLPVLSLSAVSRIIDIPKNDFGTYFKDKELKEWELIGDSIVNGKLYKDRLKYVEELEDKGLDEEDTKLLIKAIDYLTFMQKGLRNVPKYVDDIEDRKELINEDIADLRGLYGQPHVEAN